MNFVSVLKPRGARIGLICGLLLIVAHSHAHLRQRQYLPENDLNTAGLESIVHWNFSKPVRVEMHQFSGTLGAGSSLDLSAAETEVSAAIGQWNTRSLAGVFPLLSLSLNSGRPFGNNTPCETLAGTSGDPDGINNVVFTSKASPGCTSLLSQNSGVIGLTRVRYNALTGEIIEADIQFDDTEFRFVTSANNLASVPKQINIRDVATHEFGHFFGLDHSPVRESTMLYSIADGLGTTESDDLAGLVSLYPPTSSSLMTLRGSVTADGDAVFGSVVRLIHANTLQTIATEMSNPDGVFEFCGVPSVPLVALTQSYKPLSAVHPYYGGTGDGVTVRGDLGCFNPSCQLARQGLKTFVQGTSTGDLGIRAELRSPSESQNGVWNMEASSQEPSFGTPLSGGSGSNLVLGQAYFLKLGSAAIPRAGSGDLGVTHRFRWELTGSGPHHLEIRTASLSLSSRLELALSLTREDSSPTGCSAPIPFDTASGRDPSISCTAIASGVYTLDVTASGAHCAEIPGNGGLSCLSEGELSSFPEPYYLLSVYDPSLVDSAQVATASWEAGLSVSAKWPDLPSCGAKSSSFGDSREESDGGGCCGTLRTVDPPSGGDWLKLLAFQGLVAFLGVAALWKWAARLNPKSIDA